MLQVVNSGVAPVVQLSFFQYMRKIAEIRKKTAEEEEAKLKLKHQKNSTAAKKKP